ncbi:uncharacterized protein B0H18DRAFT_956243 [Fomitopsis serialis]|uniref:uncharacterized protein n=1 Tax=Fomitopsis serialis TaxID=139415 RepID=UPI00200722F8|nr:uncharacterized protein B0H18DRAFT_956243 [Neoantrodia serialis]KAH9922515.1 hypothetical protein B0H18DRAFT_956243 [Neoantrodia serialis]
MQTSPSNVTGDSHKHALPAGALEPTTVLRCGRYDAKKARVSPGHTSIKVGLYSSGREPEPQYLPPFWSAHTHPEGQRYFVRESRPRIITEANLCSSAMQEIVATWIEAVERLCIEQQITLPDDTELYLEPNEDSGSCRYYAVDYPSRVVFWLEEASSDVLDLPATVTDSHLRIALEEHYWTHVEYFSMHRCRELDLSLEQLKSILLHARVDQMTSATSTFPYNAAECSGFLDVVKAAQECAPDGHIVATIARLWNVIFHYGEEHARLSRDQSILDCPATTPSCIFRALSRLCFRIPEANVHEFDQLYVDNLVYVEPWRKAMKAHRGDWLLHASWALALLIVDVLSLIVPRASRHLALASMLFCNMSLMSAVILSMRHQWATTSDASDAASYLNEAQRESSGFCWTAFAFSLPKALFLWALVLSSMQGFVWLAVVADVYALVAYHSSWLLSVTKMIYPYSPFGLN